MPVVPQVDVHGTRSTSEQHQHINGQTDGDDKGSYCRVVCYRSSSRPTHIKDAQLQVVHTHNGLQGRAQRTCQQACHYGKPHKSYTYVQTRQQCFSWLNAQQQSQQRKDDGHHNGCAQTYNVREPVFHITWVVFLCRQGCRHPRTGYVRSQNSKRQRQGTQRDLSGLQVFPSGQRVSWKQ